MFRSVQLMTFLVRPEAYGHFYTIFIWIIFTQYSNQEIVPSVTKTQPIGDIVPNSLIEVGTNTNNTSDSTTTMTSQVYR